MTMPRITISYRRTDSADITGRIFDRLEHHYGRDSVFVDVDAIPIAVDFRKYIGEALKSTDFFLAVVGPRWRGPRDDGTFRIDDHNDPVRVELEAAIQNDLTIVPILVGGASMPTPSELPAMLRGFADINAAVIDSGKDFRVHFERLTTFLDKTLAAREAENEAAAKRAAEAERAEELRRVADAERERLRLAAEAARRAEMDRVAEEDARRALLARQAEEAAQRERTRAIDDPARVGAPSAQPPRLVDRPSEPRQPSLWWSKAAVVALVVAVAAFGAFVIANSHAPRAASESSPAPIAVTVGAGAGEVLFAKKCGDCHSVGPHDPFRNGPGLGRLFNDPKNPRLMNGADATPQNVAQLIKTGDRGVMPGASQTRVSNLDIANLVAYLMSLSKK